MGSVTVQNTQKSFKELPPEGPFIGRLCPERVLEERNRDFIQVFQVVILAFPLP